MLRLFLLFCWNYCWAPVVPDLMKRPVSFYRDLIRHWTFSCQTASTAADLMKLLKGGTVFNWQQCDIDFIAADSRGWWLHRQKELSMLSQCLCDISLFRLSWRPGWKRCVRVSWKASTLLGHLICLLSPHRHLCLLTGCLSTLPLVISTTRLQWRLLQGEAGGCPVSSAL